MYHRFLLNIIPPLRDGQGLVEYITAGTVTGAYGGHLFSNQKELGFDEVKLKGRFTFKQLALMRGIGYGFLFGLIAGVYSDLTSSRSAVNEIRKWEKYWKQRQQVCHNIHNVLL